MGAVFLAVEDGTGREVAMKVLLSELAQNEDFRSRFERESRYASALDHPNIVRVHEFGEANGVAYMVMDYVPGTGPLRGAGGRPARPRADDRDPGAGGERAGRGPRERPLPPRRQAGEHPGGRGPGIRRAALPPDRLRPEQAPLPGQQPSDERRLLRRHEPVRGPRADPRAGPRPSRGRLLARVPALRVPDRRAAVPAPARGAGALRAHPGPAAEGHRGQAGPSRGDRRRGGKGAREEARGAPRELRRARGGRARGAGGRHFATEPAGPVGDPGGRAAATARHRRERPGHGDPGRRTSSLSAARRPTRAGSARTPRSRASTLASRTRATNT